MLLRFVAQAWRSDNQGPHAYDEAMGIFNATQQMFPNAVVQASDAFDDFITAVEPFKQNLPLVTAEIGDTCACQPPPTVLLSFYQVPMLLSSEGC